jgi:hypothetical protein
MTEKKNEQAAMNTMKRCGCELHGWEMERLQLFTLASSEKRGRNLSLMDEENYNKNFRHRDCRWHNSHLCIHKSVFSELCIVEDTLLDNFSQWDYVASCGIRYMITMRRDTRMTLIMYLYTFGRQWVIVGLVGRFGIQRSLFKILVIVGYQTIRQFPARVLLAVVGSGAFL